MRNLSELILRIAKHYKNNTQPYYNYITKHFKKNNNFSYSTFLMNNPLSSRKERRMAVKMFLDSTR